VFNPLDFFGLQVEIEDFQVGFHVGRVGGAGQGNHAQVESEPKNDLARSSAVALGDLSQFGAEHQLAVGGEQGKALIDQSV